MKKKVFILIGILILLISVGISYAYFSARVIGSESVSTIKAVAANLSIKFTDNSPTINGTNLVPGWSATKTFSVENTGEVLTYYVIKITNITNNLLPQGISYQITSNNGGANIARDTIPYIPMAVSSVIELPTNTTHNYTITTYYNNLEYDQSVDYNKTFSYTVTIEAVNKKEINYIEDLVDLSNSTRNNNSYQGTFFILTKDLDFNNNSSYRNPNDTSYGDLNENGEVETIKNELTNVNGKGFRMIGKTDNTNDFQGYFDGGNHRIDNVYMSSDATNESAFFNKVQNTTIMNLTISGTSQTTNTSKASGGLIATAKANTVIYNCHSEININNVSSTSASTGGLVQWVNGNTYIKNSSNDGTITNGNNIAGIVGYVQNTQDAKTLILENVTNNGNITNNTGNMASGLIGMIDTGNNEGLIINSINNGTITNNSTKSSNKYAVGLVGNVKRKLSIYYSKNQGSIISNCSVTNSYHLFSGGFVGYIDNNSSNPTNIYYSQNTGDIIATITRTGNIFIGSLVSYPGGSYGSINNSLNTGNITLTYDNATSVNIKGIIALQNNMTVNNTTSTGTITINQITS